MFVRIPPYRHARTRQRYVATGVSVAYGRPGGGRVKVGTGFPYTRVFVIVVTRLLADDACCLRSGEQAGRRTNYNANRNGFGPVLLRSVWSLA